MGKWKQSPLVVDMELVISGSVALREGELLSSGSRICPICGDAFLYIRSTKRVCGRWKCINALRKINKSGRWVQLRGEF